MGSEAFCFRHWKVDNIGAKLDLVENDNTEKFLILSPQEMNYFASLFHRIKMLPSLSGSILMLIKSLRNTTATKRTKRK